MLIRLEVIYSVEQHPDYVALLEPLWAASESGQIQVVSSEMILLETLTGALKRNDPQIIADYERVLIVLDDVEHFFEPLAQLRMFS